MNTRTTVLIGSLVLGFALFAPAQDAAPEVVVPASAEWKWLHPTDGKDPAAAEAGFNENFATLKYDDAKWQTGKDSDTEGGGFGYGDPAGVTWEVPAAAEDRKSAYLRHKFTTKKAYQDLVISMQRDDGVVVYLDGKEAGRDNVGEGRDSYDLMSEKTVGGEAEKAPVEIRLSGTLAAGEHILAISLHNRSGGSSDLRVAGITLKGVAAK